MAKCFLIHKSSSVDVLFIEDGVLKPTNMEVHRGQFIRFTEKSYKTYKDNGSITVYSEGKRDLSDFGLDIVKCIVSTFFDIDPLRISANMYVDYYKDTTFIVKESYCSMTNWVHGLTDNCDLQCTLKLNLPEFTIDSVILSDVNTQKNSEEFTISELKGYCVLSQKTEIMNLVNQLKKKYKSSIKHVRDEDGLIQKLFKHIDFGSNEPPHDFVKDYAKFRQDNNLYMGPMFNQMSARAQDKAILNQGRK